MSKPVVEEHFRHLKKLVEWEEAEEIETFRKEFLELSPEAREATGKTLRHLKFVNTSFSPAGHVLITLSRSDGKPMPFFTLDVGDMATLSPDHGVKMKSSMGTVYERDRSTITVAFNKIFPEDFLEGTLTLNKTANRSTYEVMYETLDLLAEVRHGRLNYFRSLSFGLKPPVFVDPLDFEFFDAGLNEPQQKAVHLAMRAKDIALIHGPPGTGKTRVLVEIIRQAHARGEFIFASAPSNVSCDNLLERLAAAGLPVLRLGHPARIMDHLRDHSLDHQLALHPYARMIEDLQKEIDLVYKHRNRKKDRGSYRRSEIEDFNDEIERLKVERRHLSDQLFRNVIDEARIILGTHVAGASNLFGDKTFDLVVLDEASQATEPLSWIPLCRAKRAVLAGDHYQLPPTVRSVKAEEGGLGRTLFERFIEVIPEESKCLLTIQYRMHKHIMGFSSAEFYSGQLVADKSVVEHTLADMDGVLKNEKTKEAFLFVDTAGCGFEEANEPGTQSRFNRKEAELALKFLEELLSFGVKRDQIALICPYSAQVRLLDSLLPEKEKDIEVGSVDGFQGREKEVVIVTLVRSNLEGELGFLVDKRRMNVALTRARRKLIVIGDSATLSSIPFYRDFFTYAESIKGYQSAWEYIN